MPTITIDIPDRADDVHLRKEGEGYKVVYYFGSSKVTVDLPQCQEAICKSPQRDLWLSKIEGGRRVPNVGRKMLVEYVG